MAYAALNTLLINWLVIVGQASKDAFVPGLNDLQTSQAELLTMKVAVIKDEGNDVLQQPNQDPIVGLWVNTSSSDTSTASISALPTGGFGGIWQNTSIRYPSPFVCTRSTFGSSAYMCYWVDAGTLYANISNFQMTFSDGSQWWIWSKTTTSTTSTTTTTTTVSTTTKATVLPQQPVKLVRGNTAMTRRGMQPVADSRDQLWNLRKCSDMSGANVAWNQGDRAFDTCLGKNQNWNDASPLRSGDVVAWVSVVDGQVQDCAGWGCSTQVFPPPGGHWGTPFTIVKYNGGQAAIKGAAINFGDSIYFYGGQGNSWSPNHIISCDGSACGGRSSHTIASSLFILQDTTATAATTAATATTTRVYDATRDFSGSSNPNGVWSSGWTSSLGSELRLFPRFGKPPCCPPNIWYDPAIESSGTPCFWLNHFSTSMYGILPGQLVLHGGCNNNQFAVLRFTSPSNGDCIVAGKFTAGDGGTTSGDILLNGVRKASYPSTNDSPSFSVTLSVTAGSTIDFVVGTVDGCGSDSTGLVATITMTR
jgi:hypothetical protein